MVVIDNLVNGKRENLANVPGDITLLEDDIRDTAACCRVLRDAETVYHLACLGVRHSVHSPMDEPRRERDRHASRCSRRSRAAGVPKFVYVSSSEVYGTAKWVPMTEDHPTFPCTVLRRIEAGGRVLHARLLAHVRLSHGRRPAVQHTTARGVITKATAVK